MIQEREVRQVRRHERGLPDLADLRQLRRRRGGEIGSCDGADLPEVQHGERLEERVAEPHGDGLLLSDDADGVDAHEGIVARALGRDVAERPDRRLAFEEDVDDGPLGRHAQLAPVDV